MGHDAMIWLWNCRQLDICNTLGLVMKVSFCRSYFIDSPTKIHADPV